MQLTYPLQVRTRGLNDDLADQFRRWHPGFTHTPKARQPGSPPPRNLPRFAPLSRLASRGVNAGEDL